MRHEIIEFRLVDLLESRLAAMSHRPKRVRTRAALIAATAREMERSEGGGLAVARIADGAGTAHGTFYLYFSNTLDAAMAVRRLYSAAVSLFRPRSASALPPFAAILHMNKFYVRNFSKNAELLRALQLLLYVRPDLGRHRDRVNNKWSSSIVRDLERRTGTRLSSVPRAASRTMARSAIAMADELLREVYIHKSPSLAAMRANDELLIQQLSVSWYRIIYGKDPSPKDALTRG